MNPQSRSGLVLFGVLVIAIVGFVGVVQLGSSITPTGTPYAHNPITLALELGRGAPWPAASLWLATLAVLILIAAAVLLIARAPHRGVVNARRHMAGPAELSALLRRSRAREAARLHPTAENLPPGQQVGRLLGGRLLGRGQWVYQGWRDLSVSIYGTGRGKTSSQVIPHMLRAPGAAIMTTNKVDGVEEVLAGRRRRGTQYIFDPQQIYRKDARPDFIFNPLEHIDTVADALELAAIFEASTAKETDRGGDPQFDSSGRSLLAHLLLAGALDQRALSEVFAWLAKSHGTTALSILKAHGRIGPGDAIFGVLEQPDRTAGSVFATAQRMAQALADDELMLWTSAPGVRKFRPEEFITSTDTLVLLSKEGAGSGGAILTALVRAICKRAEKAAQGNGGRLPVPIVVELDECANIVRWPELPSVYSFYGSLGIILSSYFQSRSQGNGAFGQDGMQTIWDAAACRVYGGGSGDDVWLRSLSALIGDYDQLSHGTTSGRDGQQSTNVQTRRMPIMDVAALGSLPPWHAIVFPSQTRPAIVKTIPWFKDRALKKLVDEGRRDG